MREVTFEACSSFTRVPACWIAQPPTGGLARKASVRPVAQPDRLPNDQTKHTTLWLERRFTGDPRPSGRTQKSGLAGTTRVRIRNVRTTTRRVRLSADEHPRMPIKLEEAVAEVVYPFFEHLNGILRL